MNNGFKRVAPVIYLTLFLLLIGCGDDEDRQATPPPQGIEQEIGQLSMTRMQNGVTKWKLNARTATLMEFDQVKVEGVELVIFGEKEGETTTIRGNKGEVNRVTNNVRITGNVEGTFSGGGRLTTDEIYWRDADRKIYTMPGTKVTIEYEGSVIVGEELEAKPEQETVKMKNVNGTTRVEEKQDEKATR